MVLNPKLGSTAEVWYPASPWAMRDAAHAALADIADFKKVFKVAPNPTASEDLPCLVVHFRDSSSAEGQENQGAPHFKHRTMLYLSILDAADSPLVLDGKIWSLGETALIRLLQDPTWVREYAEGIQLRGMEMRLPREGETYLAELRIEFETTTVSIWEPLGLPKLREVVIQRRLTETQTEEGLDEREIYPDWDE